MMVRTARIDEGHVAYTDTGSGFPVVLLHGGVLDHRMWSRQIGPLAARYRVIAPDARGHGGSSTPTAAFRHCDDVAALLRHLRVGSAALVGLSMGAGTAVDTAVENPGLVDALVVSGAGTSDPDWRDPWVLDIQETWARQQQARDRGGWIDTFLRFAHGPHRVLDDVDPEVVTQLREQAETTLTAHVPAGAPVLPSPVPGVRARARGIGVPTLAICGDLDAADHLRMARELVESVADGSALTVTGSAHYPNMERPAEFNDQLLRFLAKSCPA